MAETILSWLFVVVWVTAGWWAPALCTVVVLTLWRATADAEALDHDELTGVLSRRSLTRADFGGEHASRTSAEGPSSEGVAKDMAHGWASPDPTRAPGAPPGRNLWLSRTSGKIGMPTSCAPDGR